jgi:hypothetical protein
MRARRRETHALFTSISNLPPLFSVIVRFADSIESVSDMSSRIDSKPASWRAWMVSSRRAEASTLNPVRILITYTLERGMKNVPLDLYS